MQSNNPQTVLTLDAGGTNFVFSAVRDFHEVVDPITFPAHADDLEQCLSTLIEGFRKVSNKVGDFEAISFAFPGPADYALGIIGDLPNFPAFTGGVALGPMLQEKFRVPVFINNDGDLFASGHARFGFLPQLNQRLHAAGSKKIYKNLIGITLGTGMGCGVMIGDQLLRGDNSCGASIHSTLNPFNHAWNAEESVSTRAIQRVYSELSGLPFSSLVMPRTIYDIAKGNVPGNKEAARGSFEQFGRALGNSISNVMSLVDGAVVLGGGLSSAWDLFSPAMFEEVNRPVVNFQGAPSAGLPVKVLNLESPKGFAEFAIGKAQSIPIPGTDKFVMYDALQRSGIGLSKLNSSLAISLGAYAFAVQKLDSYA